MKKIFYGKFSIGEVLLAGYAYVFARRLFVPFHRLLFHVALRGLGVFNSINFKISGEHYLIHQLLPRLLSGVEKPIFFDVGANEGKFSKELKSAFPRADIFSFEPHPQTYARVKEQLAGMATVLHCGLGDACSKMVLYDVADAQGTSHASLFSGVVERTDKPMTSVEVEVRTVDDVCEEHQIPQIDFLKIDTEGNEYPVLVGAASLLKNNAVGIIHFEFNEMNIVSGHFLRDFEQLLTDFQLYRLLPKGLVILNDMPILTELYGFQNVIAIRKDLTKRL